MDNWKGYDDVNIHNFMLYVLMNMLTHNPWRKSVIKWRLISDTARQIEGLIWSLRIVNVLTIHTSPPVFHLLLASITLPVRIDRIGLVMWKGCQWVLGKNIGNQVSSLGRESNVRQYSWGRSRPGSLPFWYKEPCCKH